MSAGRMNYNLNTYAMMREYEHFSIAFHVANEFVYAGVGPSFMKNVDSLIQQWPRVL